MHFFSYDGSNSRFVDFGDLWRTLGITSVDFSKLTHTSSSGARKRKCLNASEECPIEKRRRCIREVVSNTTSMDPDASCRIRQVDKGGNIVDFKCPFCNATFSRSQHSVFRRSICHVVRAAVVHHHSSLSVI